MRSVARVAEVRTEFTGGRKISGASPDNACHLLGMWSQGLTQTLIWVDLTLNHCLYGNLNRRDHGCLILARPDRSGRVSAQSIGAAFTRDVAKYFDIQGILRR
jgi:hypothetical protein